MIEISEKKWINWFWAIFFFIITAIIFFVIIFASNGKIVQDISAIQCCNGQQCTDTYYTEKDNKCHLVLCENSIFMKNCTYEGANKTIDLQGETK